MCFVSHMISAEAGLNISAGQVTDAHPVACSKKQFSHFDTEEDPWSTNRDHTLIQDKFKHKI